MIALFTASRGCPLLWMLTQWGPLKCSAFSDLFQFLQSCQSMWSGYGSVGGCGGGGAVRRGGVSVIKAEHAISHATRPLRLMGLLTCSDNGGLLGWSVIHNRLVSRLGRNCTRKIALIYRLQQSWFMALFHLYLIVKSILDLPWLTHGNLISELPRKKLITFACSGLMNSFGPLHCVTPILLAQLG